jgi:hypothetical protein
MNTGRLFITAAALALTAVAAQSADKPTRAEKNQAKLAEMIKGRTAGEPVSCIPAYRSSGLTIIEGVAMVYDAGDVIYVSKPTDADMLGDDDIVVIDRRGGQLCNTDVVRTIDRTGGFHTGVVFLGKFVPYRKQR